MSVNNVLSSVTHRWNRLHYYNIYIYRLRGYVILPPVATLDSFFTGYHSFNMI